jgi:hypothetical protein
MQTSSQVRSVFHRTALALVLLGLVAAPAAAQFDSAQMSGFVKDAQGQMVPGASVRIQNQATQLERNYATDGSGYYVATNLPPGLYTLTIEITGFKKFVETGIRLDAAAKLGRDVMLETGGLEETVTVTAESATLQTNTGQMSKTIESKQIQDLMLNGRNPINLALLKPGVRGSNFNNFQPDSLTSGGFNINGSRTDENLITIDGAIATRTRSAGAIIGTLNVDTVAEIQVLTASYLPEYGRSSGGQIRFVTRSGGRDFHGDLYGFFRDEGLDANTWTRNRAGLERATYDYKQFGYDVGGPVFIPGKFNENRDKLFFFWAQEWINWYQDSTSTGTVPSLKMRDGDFSELLDPANPFFGRSVIVRDPATGQPFPNNVIPANMLSPNGLGMLRAYPEPTAGYQVGAQNWIGTSPNPRDTRKDTIRLDWVPSAGNQVSLRGSFFHWKSVDAFRGTFPIARTDWNRPNETIAASWMKSITPSVLNEATFGWSRDRVYIEVFRGTDAFLRSKAGITYPYIYPGKEIEDKIPTISMTNFSEVDGGPYPAASFGPIWTFSDNLTWIKGRHTFKAGVFVEYSGEDDFDQINVAGQPGDTNNQNGRFEFRDTSTPGGTNVAIANAAMGRFTNYGEIGTRSKTDWRALAIDLFVQDSWKARSNLTVEYGVRYAYWPPWHAQLNNIAHFDPSYYNPGVAAVIDPRTGAILAGDRFNGVVLPANGFPADASGQVPAADDPQYQRLFHGLPEGFSETHAAVFQPRLGLAWTLNPKTVVRLGAGVFHTRVTLNDSTLLGGNPPIQFKVGVSNGSVDQPGGTTAQNFPLVMTAQDVEFKHPTAYSWNVSLQRQLPWSIIADVSYVGRSGQHLQRERNLNQLQPGAIQANPGVNVAALRPYLGFGAIRLSENAGRSLYNGLQLNLERRFRGGLGFGVAYTYSKLSDNGADKRNIMFNAYDDSGYWGVSDNDRTHVLNFNYLWELPFWRTQDTLLKKILGGWQISGVTFFQSGVPFSVRSGNDIAGVGDTTPQPYNLVGDVSVSNPSFSQGRTVDQNLWFNPLAFAAPAAGTFGNSGKNIIRGPSFNTWDIALFKNVPLGGTRRLQLRLEAFNFLNHPNLDNPATAGTGGGNGNILNPTSPDFGRVLGKGGTVPSNRNIQLGVKFSF